MTVDTKDLRGAVTKGARVEWMDPEVPPVMVEMTGRIWEPLEIEPPYLLIEAFPGQRKPATVTITNHTGSALRIVEVRATSRGVETSLQETEAGFRYRLTVDTDPKLPPGGYSGQVELHLATPDLPNPRIPLTLIVKRKVHLDLGAVVFRSPVILLTIEKHKDPEFEVKNIRCDLPFVAIETIALPDEDETARRQLKFTLRSDNWPAKPFQGKVTFETNDLDFPRFTLPVMGPGRAPASSDVAR